MNDAGLLTATADFTGRLGGQSIVLSWRLAAHGLAAPIDQMPVAVSTAITFDCPIPLDPQHQ